MYGPAEPRSAMTYERQVPDPARTRGVTLPRGRPRRAAPSRPRAVQFCDLGKAVGEEPVEAEGVDVDGLAHVGDPVRAQDVERERAQAGEDAGPAPDAAVVLPQHAVAHVMVTVLDPPVRPDRPPEVLGVQPDLADVVGDLAPRAPQAGAGVLAPAPA